MSTNKQEILNMLQEEFNRWEELLAGLSEAQITAPRLPGNWSIKDVVAHLWSWQQRSVARMEAALHNREPEFPRWPESLQPDSEEDLEQLNTWLYESNRDKPWSTVYSDWRTQFLRFIELAEAISESNLLQPGRYTWLGQHPLSLILVSSYEHHHLEHLEPLLASLDQQRPEGNEVA
jgi:hypothetical protein